MKYNLDTIFNISKDNAFMNIQEDMFGYIEKIHDFPRYYDQKDIDLVFSYFSRGFDISCFNENARKLYELSAYAFDIFIHAWMSEHPIETQLLSFSRRVIAAGKNTGGDQKQRRREAERTANDRGDDDTRIVHEAAYKAGHEIHRIMGLLRFSPDEAGTFIAYCEPDHFIIPALAEYFTARFAETAWLIIDKKRKLFLSRKPGETARLALSPPDFVRQAENQDEWEELWKHYHKTINNESRNNAGLQRQLMPKRYWKYLPEV